MAKAVYFVVSVLLLFQHNGFVIGEASDPSAEVGALQTSLQEALKQVEGLKAAAARSEDVKVQDAAASVQQVSAAEAKASAAFEADAALRESKSAADSQLASLSSDSAALKQQIATLKAQLSSSSAEATALKQAVAAAQETQNSASEGTLAEVAALKQALAQAEAESATAQQTAKTAASAAEADLKTKTAQLQKAESDLRTVSQQLQAEKSANAADKAALKKAQASAEAAEARLAAADAKVAAAEAKATDAQTLADRLLAQHYEAWMPHWVADGYERRVRPVAVSAYDSSRSAASALHRSGSKAWDTVSPTLQPYVDQASESVGKIVKHPHLVAAKQRVQTAFAAITDSKGIKIITQGYTKVHAELEVLAATVLKKHPLLAPLAEAGVVGWVVTFFLSLPVLVLLFFRKGRAKPRSTPALSASSGTGSRANKARKGRRISVGTDTVNFA